MNEIICRQGHVIEKGKDRCSRCNSTAPVLEAPAEESTPKKTRKPRKKEDKKPEKKKSVVSRIKKAVTGRGKKAKK